MVLLISRALDGLRRCRLPFAAAILAGALAFPQSVPSTNAAVERRVDSILRQMTLEEKIDMIGGIDEFFIRPRPYIPRPVPRVPSFFSISVLVSRERPIPLG